MTAPTQSLPIQHTGTIAPIGPVRPDILQATDIRPDTESGAGESDAFCSSVARVASQLLDVPIAFVSTFDADVRMLRGAVDRDGDPIPRYLLLADYTAAVRNPYEAIRGVVSHLEIPLYAVGGNHLGSLCVADRRQRMWTAGERTRLRELADMLGHQLVRPMPSGSRQNIRNHSRQLADEIAAVAASVYSLADLADQHDDPRMHRFAATSRKRLDSALSTAASLREATGAEDFVPQRVHTFDLRQAVNRALREATFVTGRNDVDADLGAIALPVAGDQFGTERAITHLVTATLHYSTAARTQVMLRTVNPNGTPTAALTVSTGGGVLPAAEIARMIARFESAEDARGDHARSSIRMIDGEVRAAGDAVAVHSHRAGTSCTAYWPLARG